MIDKIKDKIISIKRKEKGQISLREKALKGLALFFAVIICFTILSRTADSMTIPQVEVEQLSKKNIFQEVKLNGILSANQEKAVSIPLEQKIKQILVLIGQQVKKGDVLAQLDIEYLNETISDLESEITKQKMKLEDLKSGNDVSAYENAQSKNRAVEDYNQAANKEGQAVNQSYEAMIQAQKELEAFDNRKGDLAGGDTTLEFLENTLSQKEKDLKEANQKKEQLELEMKHKIESEKQRQFAEKNEALTEKELNKIEKMIQKEYKAILNDADKKIESANNEVEKANHAIDEYKSSKQTQDEKNEEQIRQELKQNFDARKQEYEMALSTQNESLTQAKRGIEDANKPQVIDSTVKLEEMELAEKEKNLLKLKEILEFQGQIIAPADGVITNITATAGALIQEGNGILMADQAKGYKVVVQIPKDQQKFVTVGDEVKLTTSDDKVIESLSIDFLNLNAEDPELMDATIFVQSDNVMLGGNVTVEVLQSNCSYNNSLPIAAIHSDGNKYYVLVLKEIDTVLGKELIAEQVDVTIIQKNGTYAAVADGEVSPDQYVITGSNRNISSGDRVRLAEN